MCHCNSLSVSIKKQWIAVFLAFLSIGFVLFLVSIKKLELIPTTMLSTIAVYFSYYAYLFSREKFRLDLYKDRLKIYEGALTFQSTVVKHGGLTAGTTEDSKKEILQAFLAAEESFRGLGYHRHKFLFGKDIQEYFKRLNEDYAWLRSYGPQNQPAAHTERVHDVYKKLEQLPDLFAPYLSFAEYRR
jgi:hypothetical protein